MNNMFFDDYFYQMQDLHDTGLYFKNKGKEQFFSYPKVFKASHQAGFFCTQQGLDESDRLALILPNTSEFVFIFLGAMAYGIIPCALYPPLRLGNLSSYKEKLKHQLNILKPKGLVTLKVLMPMLKSVVQSLDFDIKVFSPSDFFGENDFSANRMHRRSAAFIQFSSGTTGEQKPVVITHENLAHNVGAIVSSLGIDRKIDSGVSWLPLYHDMGLVGGLFGALASGATQTLLRPEEFLSNPKIWPQELSQKKASITVAPNFAFGLLSKKVTAEMAGLFDLSHLRIILCGAEMVQQKTVTGFLELFSHSKLKRQAFLPVYGMSEATLAVTFSSPEIGPIFNSFDRTSLEMNGKVLLESESSAQALKLTSVGRPLPGIEVQILDQTGQRLGPQMLGEIYIAGQSIAEKYFTGEKVTNEADLLATGDLGFFYRDDLYIYGRKKDLIIIRGRNIDPSVVEKDLWSIKGVRPGKVVAIPDLDTQNDTEGVAILFEQEKKNKRPQGQIEKDIMHALLALHGISATKIKMIKSGILPRTSSGKLQRNLCQRFLLEDKKRPLMSYLKQLLPQGHNSKY